MDLLFERAWAAAEAGRHKEFVTGNNDADGVYLLYLGPAPLSRAWPSTSRAKLAQWGGNASGVNVANIDNLGNVHPDTFWWHYNLGNVRERRFSEIWTDTSRPDHGRAQAAAAPDQGPLRRLPVFRHLRRQHPGPRHAIDRRSLG